MWVVDKDFGEIYHSYAKRNKSLEQRRVVQASIQYFKRLPCREWNMVPKSNVWGVCMVDQQHTIPAAIEEVCKIKHKITGL
eukprot:7172057-Ditylum_brightwellii.AAC.1